MILQNHLNFSKSPGFYFKESIFFNDLSTYARLAASNPLKRLSSRV